MLAGSMISLELAWIVGLLVGEFLDPDGYNNDEGEMTTGSTLRRRRLVLPLVTEVRCALRFGEFRELQGIIGCCPNLLKLTIIPDTYVDLDRIARNVRVYCQKI